MELSDKALLKEQWNLHSLQWEENPKPNPDTFTTEPILRLTTIVGMSHTF